MKQVVITKAVKIKNQRVKIFSGEKKYLATGGLMGNNIETEIVTYKSKPSRADLLVNKNQVIVARMKETNKVLLIDENTDDLIVSTGFLVLDVQEGWYPKFLFYYFSSDFFQKQKNKLSIGATQKAINNEKFKEIVIPEISYEDQKNIVRILDQADVIRQKRKQAISLLDDYLKSVFLEMFGDPVKNEKGYSMKKISDIAIKEKNGIKAGPFGSSLKKEFYVKSGYKIYGQEQVIKNNFNYGDYYINEEKYCQLESCKIQQGDILISLVGTFGKISVVPDNFEPGIINPRLMKITPNQTIILPLFLKELLINETTQKQIKGMSHGGTMGIVNVGIVKNIKIIVPNIEEQKQYLQIKKKIGLIKQSMLAQSMELENQFQSLMQKAFKGEL
ncbi:MAG: hypothetical protein MNSN_05210 [Minisyncoccus archaeiphilus]|uniref:restriction endonuclease subunit S n=1 Tax=Minisyncoccus archaeiphilus TaxID=3238481 RepID=UPI002B16FC2E|nr:MAG: hypothetical protein MNSN_05210 [Candidatus Parcubacteria bacterium]